MTRTLTRTNLHSSKLIRVLTDLALVDAAEPGDGFAEALSLWVDFNHAIALGTLHNASPANVANPALAQGGMTSVTSAALGEEFTRVRGIAVRSMEKSAPTHVARAQIELLRAQADEPMDVATAYEPYRRYYAAQQRDMGLNIRALRAQVRVVLAKASPGLKMLADMDAAFDGVLSDREGKLLSTVPLLLERRFAQLRKAHQDMLTDVPQADNPALWMQPGAWLTRFCHEMQTVLLAELEVRLQPTLGLIEAFDNVITKPK
jgi:hypothetical protein